jgi:hypothetical protein
MGYGGRDWDQSDREWVRERSSSRYREDSREKRGVSAYYVTLLHSNLFLLPLERSGRAVLCLDFSTLLMWALK